MPGLLARHSYMLIVGTVLFFGVAIGRLVSAVAKDMRKMYEGNVGAMLGWPGGTMVPVAAVAFVCIIMVGIETASMDALDEYARAISNCW